MTRDAGAFMVVLTAQSPATLRNCRLHLAFLRHYLLALYGPPLELAALQDQAWMEQVIGADSAQRQLEYDGDSRSTALFLEHFESVFLVEFLASASCHGLGEWFQAFDYLGDDWRGLEGGVGGLGLAEILDLGEGDADDDAVVARWEPPPHSLGGCGSSSIPPRPSLPRSVYAMMRANCEALVPAIPGGGSPPYGDDHYGEGSGVEPWLVMRFGGLVSPRVVALRRLTLWPSIPPTPGGGGGSQEEAGEALQGGSRREFFTSLCIWCM